jgi:uncharacterized protein YraI
MILATEGMRTTIEGCEESMKECEEKLEDERIN